MFIIGLLRVFNLFRGGVNLALVIFGFTLSFEVGLSLCQRGFSFTKSSFHFGNRLLGGFVVLVVIFFGALIAILYIFIFELLLEGFGGGESGRVGINLSSVQVDLVFIVEPLRVWNG